MEFLALTLAVLAVLLAIPVPIVLRAAKFRTRSPWAAMLLWQTIALAGGLSMVGAPIVYGLSPFGSSVPEALRTAARLTLDEDYSALGELDVHPWHIFSLCFGILLGGHLLLTLGRTYARVLSARKRHRQLVDLLSTPAQVSESHADTQIIEHAAPLAYCLPGRTNARSVTVLSRGLLNTLTEAELAAVLAHEQTHLRQRHHLLTMAFEAWYRAIPWLPTTRYGREAVLEITEMLADEGALAEHSREDLLRSLALSSSDNRGSLDNSGSVDSPSVAGKGAPTATVPADTGSFELSAGSEITGARLQRLLAPKPALGTAAVCGVVVVSLCLLAVPTFLLLS